MKLKIAVVVHGRFHAFDLVRELIKQEHEVTLLTNYPKFITQKFGIPNQCIKSFLLHGVLIRVISKLQTKIYIANFEPFLHTFFSKWAAREILKHDYDVVYVFSGIAEEVFESLSDKNILKLLARGSSHIRTQFELLSGENERANLPVDERKNSWIINREEREYKLSNSVIVLSTFAYKSFIAQGFTIAKLRLMLSGTQADKFRPNEEIINERYQRILLNQPLRVLMVGTFSLRKGAIDLIKIASLAGASFKFRFVGDISDEAKYLISRFSSPIEFIPRQPHFELPSFYAWGDVFIFTTIEDGYPAVLGQAHASGLPILATPNSSAPDIVEEGKTGWILPIRSPKSFANRLEWCNSHRQELAQMVRIIYEKFKPRDWAEVASDFTAICQNLLHQTVIQSNDK